MSLLLEPTSNPIARTYQQATMTASGPTRRHPRKRPQVQQHQTLATGNDEPAQAVDGHPGQYGSDQVHQVAESARGELKERT